MSAENPSASSDHNDIAYKFAAPAPHKKELYRMGLVNQLNASIKKRLTLLTAPSGFGKTTLLAHWAAQPHLKTAWLSLEFGDNDPAFFFRNFIRALQQVKSNIGQDAFLMLQSQENVSMEKVLLRLIDDIGMVLQDFVIVLDNFEKIQAEPVHNMLSYFLENQPPQCHLFIASRTEPPFELAKLRSAGQLSEIRKPHLSFTMDDAKGLFNEVFKLEIPYGDVSALVVRAESMPAALKQAALGLEYYENLSTFVTEFEKDEREPVVFLSEILLQKQSQPVQTFLKQIHILPFLTPSLCLTVTGNTDSAEILKSLAEAGHFIRQVGEEEIYLLQEIFLDATADIFSGLQDEKIINLNLRASLWFTQRRNIPRAFQHAVAAKNFDLAGQFVEEEAMEMLKRGELVTLLNWLQKLPSRVYEARPMLSVCQAWIAIISGQRDKIPSFLAKAEAANRHSKTPEAAAEHIAAIRDYLENVGD